jgi:hypothetical protein
MIERTFAAFRQELLSEKSVYRWNYMSVEFWEMTGT